MLYLDTSLVVAVATVERESDEVEQWLARRREEQLAISGWTITEFSAAISIKLRRKVMTIDERDLAITYFNARLLAAFTYLNIVEQDFGEAAALADRFEFGLRGGDALHLAVSARNDATRCTLDKRQAEAGRALGIRTVLVSSTD